MDGPKIEDEPDFRMKKNESKKQISEAIRACLEKKAEEIAILELEQGPEHLPTTSWCAAAAIRGRCRPSPTKWSFG